MNNLQEKNRFRFVYGRTPFEAVFSDVFDEPDNARLEKLLKVSAIKEMYDYLSQQKKERGHSSLSRGTVIEVSQANMNFAENFIQYFKPTETRSLFHKPIDHIIARISQIDPCEELIRLLRSIKNKSKWMGEDACSEIEFLSCEFFAKDRFNIKELRIISGAISSFNMMFRTKKSKKEVAGNEVTYIRKYFSQFMSDSEEFINKENKK